MKMEKTLRAFFIIGIHNPIANSNSPISQQIWISGKKSFPEKKPLSGKKFTFGKNQFMEKRHIPEKNSY